MKHATLAFGPPIAAAARAPAVPAVPAAPAARPTPAAPATLALHAAQVALLEPAAQVTLLEPAAQVPLLEPAAQVTLLEPGVAAARSAPTPPPGSATRTTVLPRTLTVGAATQLVSSTRERFESGRVLGRGGVGEVVLASDHDIDRPVAIKRLLPEMNDPSLVARFVEEIRTLGTLDHPNIVPVHDVGVDADGRYYYVMKYVKGETLEHVIERLDAGDSAYLRRYTFERRTEIFRQVLRAIQYAHARGIVHRDIKPANVMIGRFGEVLVMDWGIARRTFADGAGSAANDGAPPRTTVGDAATANTRQTAAGSILGTPMYMSPEQARGDLDTLDDRSDVYSLCVMFHELLTLRHYLASCDTLAACIEGAIHTEVPFAKTVTHRDQPPVPADLSHFIRHGVAKDPAQRYRTVTQMLDRLQRIDEGHCPIECPATFMKRVGTETANTIDRKPGAVLLGALTVCLLALTGVIALVMSVF